MGKQGSFGFGGEQRSYSFPRFAGGYIAVGASRLRGPHIPCEMVFLQADPDNTGQVWIGGSDVSGLNGMQLDAGDVTGWIPIQNLDLVYTIGSNASQVLHYLIVW